MGRGSHRYFQGIVSNLTSKGLHGTLETRTHSLRKVGPGCKSTWLHVDTLTLPANIETASKPSLGTDTSVAHSFRKWRRITYSASGSRHKGRDQGRRTLGPGPGPARAAALVPALGPKSINPSGPREHLTENSVVDTFSEGLVK